MDPFVQLLVVVLAMAVGTMAFGSLPLFLPLGQAKLRYVELVGSGLLLGASFTIVIPEGVGTVLRATDALRRPPAARPAGSSEGSAAPAVPAPSAGLTRSQVRGWAARSVPSPVPPSSPYQDSRAWQFLTDGETVIGTMLLLGFFLMFVLEQISSRADSHHHHHHSSPSPRSSHSSHSPRHHHYHHHHHSHSPRHHHHLNHSDESNRSSLAISLASRGGESNTAHAPVLQTPRPPISGASAHSPLLPGSGHQPFQSYSSSTDSGSDDPFSAPRANGPRESSPRNLAVGQNSRLSRWSQPALPSTLGHLSSTPRRHSHSAHSNTHQTHLHARDPSLCPPDTSVMLGHSHRLSTLVPPHAPSSLKTALASIVGLMIHALADGIAMGASASSTDEQLRWIVFGAILIHKAPTAFGLCSVLMARGLNKRDTLKALALFSVCTPIGALVVYLALAALFNSDKSAAVISRHESALPINAIRSSTAMVRQLGIGATLTFSGGTFLFVAMHALEDVADSPGPEADTDEEDSQAHEVHEVHGVPVGRKGKSAVTYNSNHESDLEEDVEQDTGKPWSTQHSSRHARSLSAASAATPSSPRVSADIESLAHEKGSHDTQAESVSQPTRMALVFLGSLIPKTLQLMTGGHGH